MHPCTQKLPEPERKVCETHVLRHIQTSCMWFVFVYLTLFPFLSLFPCPSFSLDLLPFLSQIPAAIKALTEHPNTHTHTHKLHIRSSSHTNSFVCELRESRCTCLFNSVCVLSKCERSVADSADSEHLIGSVDPTAVY